MPPMSYLLHRGPYLRRHGSLRTIHIGNLDYYHKIKDMCYIYEVKYDIIAKILYFCRQIINVMDKKLNRIKVVLVEKDISQKMLADKLGKSFSTVNAYCCNRQQPTLQTLEEIAGILGVTKKDLINE